MILVVIVLLINVNEAVKSSNIDSNGTVVKSNIDVDNSNSNSSIISTLTSPTTTTTTVSSTITNVTKKKIAYTITVTKDGHFVDGALVLGYSAKKIHDASKGFHSDYEAELVAFVVPTVTEARYHLFINNIINNINHFCFLGLYYSHTDGE